MSLARIKRLSKRIRRLTTDQIRAMSDEELERHLQEWERADPEGYAFVKAMTDEEFEEFARQRGIV